MLCVLIRGSKVADIREAIHPAAPVRLGREVFRRTVTGVSVFGVDQLQVLGGIIAAVPVHEVHVHGVFPRTLGDIDPDADFRGIAVNFDLIPAVAQVEVTVLLAVVGGIVVVQLQRVIPETDGALCRLHGLHLTDPVGGDGIVGPEIEGVAVGTEDVSRGNIAVPVSGEAVGRCQLCILGVPGVGAAGLDRNGGDFSVISLGSTVIHKGAFAPVVMGTGQRAVCIRLEVHQDHRHLADLHLDGGGELFVAAVGDGHGACQRIFSARSGEEIVGDGANGLRHRPLEVAVLILDAAVVALDRETQVGGLLKVQGDGRTGEGEIRDIRQGDGGAAHHLVPLPELGGHIADIASGRNEEAGFSDGTGEGVLQLPGEALGGKVRRTAGSIHAGGRELHLAAGGVELVVGAQGGVVELAVLVRSGDQQQRAGDRALHAVRGAAADVEGRGTLPLGGQHGRAAAVQIDGGDHALGPQELGLIVEGHAHGIGVLTAVRHKRDNGAVRLQADGVPGRQVTGVGAHQVLAVLQQEEGAGDGFQHIRGVRSGLPDDKAAVLEHGEVGFAPLLDDVALHDEVAQGLRGLHVEVVAVGDGQDVAAGGGLIGLGLVGGLAHGPLHVLGNLLAFAGRCTRVVAGVGSLEGGLCAGFHRHHEAGDLGIAICGVQEDVRLRHTIRDGVVRLLHDHHAAGRGHLVRRQRGEGGQRKGHAEGQDQGDQFSEARCVYLLQNSTSQFFCFLFSAFG